MKFMAASQKAMENLGKIANWLQPICAIVIKQIFLVIGRLFYCIEKVDRTTLDNFVESCVKEPFDVLRNPPDNIPRKHFAVNLLLTVLWVNAM